MTKIHTLTIERSAAGSPVYNLSITNEGVSNSQPPPQLLYNEHVHPVTNADILNFYYPPGDSGDDTYNWGNMSINFDDDYRERSVALIYLHDDRTGNNKKGKIAIKDTDFPPPREIAEVLQNANDIHQSFSIEKIEITRNPTDTSTVDVEITFKSLDIGQRYMSYNTQTTPPNQRTKYTDIDDGSGNNIKALLFYPFLDNVNGSEIFIMTHFGLNLSANNISNVYGIPVFTVNGVISQTPTQITRTDSGNVKKKALFFIEK